jgi:hypothetical protein
MIAAAVKVLPCLWLLIVSIGMLLLHEWIAFAICMSAAFIWLELRNISERR